MDVNKLRSSLSEDWNTSGIKSLKKLICDLFLIFADLGPASAKL